MFPVQIEQNTAAEIDKQAREHRKTPRQNICECRAHADSDVDRVSRTLQREKALSTLQQTEHARQRQRDVAQDFEVKGPKRAITTGFPSLATMPGR